MVSLTVAVLCARLGLPVPASGGDRVLEGIRTLGEADSTSLSFLENPAYRQQAKVTKAGAVLLRPADATLLPPETLAIPCPQPYAAYARALQIFYPEPEVAPGISQYAVISNRAQIDPTARIEPYAVIYAEATVGPSAHIGAHAVLGEGVAIGARTRIAPHATLQRCTVGDDCLIHSGVRIGQDGFGFVQQGEELIKIPHRGRVVLGNRVEVGANSTIDAGALSDTVLADDVKLDKQVQIAHNVTLGRGVRIAAQSGIAGSTTVGEWCVIGGQSGIAGHLSIAPKCMVAAASGVTKTIETPGSVVAGMPAVPITQWRQQMALLALNAKRAGKGQQAAAVPAASALAREANPAATPAQTSAQTPAPRSAPSPKPLLPLGPDTANPFVGEVY